MFPTLCRLLVPSFIAYGDTNPARIDGGQNNASVTNKFAVIESENMLVNNSIVSCDTNGMHTIKTPVEKAMEHSLPKFGELLLTLPPRWYPMVSPDRTTPMRIPQEYVVLPKTGVTIRLPAISSAMTIAPDAIATTASFQNFSKSVN
ncbi:MAG: hypothetical protein QXW91_01550 [Candidatus Nitrosotenuis sp.]